MNPHSQIGAFDKGSRNTAVIRSADFGAWDRSQNTARAVPVRCGDLAVDFMKLLIVNVLAEPFADRRDVGLKLVGVVI